MRPLRQCLKGFPQPGRGSDEVSVTTNYLVVITKELRTGAFLETPGIGSSMVSNH